MDAAKEVGTRLGQLRGDERQEDFASRLGVHRNTYARYERGERDVDAPFLIALTQQGYNPTWVLIGDGPQRLQSDAVRATVEMVREVIGGDAAAGAGRASASAPQIARLSGERVIAEPRTDYFASPSPDDFVTIPSLGILAGASRGKIAVYEPKAPLAFRRDWFVKKRLNPSHCATIEISGPSMEPLLSDCDTALLNRADKEIRSGKTYVFRLDDEIMVKHLHWLPGGVLNVISANENFAPFTIQPHEMTPEAFEVLGRVRGSSHDWD